MWLVALVGLASLLLWAKTGKDSAKKPAKEPTTAQSVKPPAKSPPSTSTTNSQTTAKVGADRNSQREPQPAGPANQRDAARIPPAKANNTQTAAPLPTADTPPLFEEYRYIQRESLLDRADNLLRAFLKAEGIAIDQVRRRQVKHTAPDGAIWYVQQMEVPCGPDRDLAALKNALLQKLASLGPDVETKADGANPRRLRLAIGVHRRLSYEVWLVATSATSSPAREGDTPAGAGVPERSGKDPGASPPAPGLPTLGRVAIVIDDFGVDLKAAKEFLTLPLALTFSVMPRQAHSREIAKLAHDHGHEILLHMPMEPHGYPQVNPGPGALLVSMGSTQVRQALQNALASVPYASGVNNHMGSTFTEQAEPLKSVLAELRSRGMYFLDSYTSNNSVACTMAEQMHVPCGRRDIFLDHEPTESFVRSQLQRLIREAKIQGTSVAIGHPHAATLKVLRQESNRFAEERVAVVPLREVLRHTPPLRRAGPH